VQVDVAEQVDGPGQERARRDYGVAAAGPAGRPDGRAEGGGAVGRAVAHRAEVGDREVPVREARPPDRGHDPVGGQIRGGPGRWPRVRGRGGRPG
jgi:hypothetical protein